jgi:K+-sensing histidine kinase KdpD
MTVLPVAYKKLIEVTRYITAITEPDELFQKLIDAAVEMTGAERGYLLLKRGPTDNQLPLGGLHPVAACRMIEEELGTAQFKASRTAIMKAFNDGKRAYWAGGISGELRSTSMEVLGLRSIICEPLKLHDEVLGVLYIDSSISKKFDEDHKEILPSFAAQAAICVENIRLIDSREEALRREHAEQARTLELQVYKETLSSFMSIASHDLKGPLTVMKTGMALLKRTKPTELQQTVIGDIEHAVERASRLVSTYLDIQKLEDGHTLAISPDRVALKSLLQSEVNLIMAPIEDRRKAALDFRMEVPDSTEIVGDPSRLSQIFGNLIENAVKYSPKGGTIELSWKRHGPYDVITIADQGLGMTEEGQKKLFARFVRLEQDHSIRGTGLGLFIVRRLVESHGGKIEVESKEGEGTTFRVYLPWAQA